MTKKEVNQQNLSFSFKIKLTKKPQAAWKINKESQGLYSQLSQNNANKSAYDPGKFSLDSMREAIGEFFTEKQKTRSVKLVTTQAGKDLFDKALLEEMQKYVNNEYRKKLSFRSKIFKQTYKFG
jgi:hypothetical protein